MRLSEIDNYNISSKHKSAPANIFNDNLDIFLSKNCPVAYNSPFKIYRGYRGIYMSTKNKIYYSDSTKFTRKSANTANYYTLLMSDILNNWKDYPKRNKSFICTTTIDKAKRYGNCFRVYPLGDPLIGICCKRDLWDSFQFDLSMFVDQLDHIFEYNDKKMFVIKRLKEIDNAWKTKNLDYKWLEDAVDIIKEFGYNNLLKLKSFSSFTEALTWLMDPTRNRFELKKLSTITESNNDQEIWFSGPAYFVKESLVKNKPYFIEDPQVI